MHCTKSGFLFSIMAIRSISLRRGVESGTQPKNDGRTTAPVGRLRADDGASVAKSGFDLSHPRPLVPSTMRSVLCTMQFSHASKMSLIVLPMVRMVCTLIRDWAIETEGVNLRKVPYLGVFHFLL